MFREHRTDIIKIALSALLFLAALLIPSQGAMRLVIFLVPYLVIGYGVLWTAARNIFMGEIFDENFLMALASVGAFCIGEYPEAVAVMLFYQIGELFEHIAVGRSRASISSLMEIRPDYAVVLRGGIEKTVSPEAVEPGEIILIKPFERIPLDGVILEGETSVNSSALTGEALPQDKSAGDDVISGTMNLGGVIKVRVKSGYAESTVAKILDLVENASSKKARPENFITRFARIYTPCVVIGALLVAVLPPLLFSQELGEWVRRALIFLVVSCPCALVVSVPMTFFSGIGGASRRGILIKGSNYLEAFSKVKTVVFDKTGTLTKGSFKVVDIHPEKVSEAELLDLAAAAESFSTHPIAESIVAAHGGHIDKARITDITERPGRGMSAIIDGKNVLVGNSALMDEQAIEWVSCELSGTLVHVAVDGVYIGHIIISDEIKPDAKKALSLLRENGVEQIVMLTGDTRPVALAVAAELGITQLYAELLPGDKVGRVEALLASKAKDTTLAFVGDGVNDAPVLSRADVGVAMGALGSDAAIEAADIVLMDDKPSKLVTALKISRKTMRIVKENIILALGVKGLVLVLGAAGLANMWFAVFADVGVLILAVLNAVRALHVRQ